MQTTTTRLAGALLLAALLPLSGCFSLSREATPQRHYVLGGGERPMGEVPAVETSEAWIGLRPLRLAEYLATPFLVVRSGIHGIGFAEFERWGESLALGANRSVASHIAARVPSWRVDTAPWSPGLRPDYLIQVHLLRFEGVTPEEPAALRGAAHLLAAWEILHPESGALLARGTTEVREEGWAVGDYPALVGMLDAGLGRLAQELILELQQLPPP